MPANYDINLDKNASFNLYVKYKDENGEVVDLSGYSADMKVIRYYDNNPESILSLRSSPYGMTSGTTGSYTSGTGVSGGITMNVSFTGAMHQNGGSAATGGIFIVADANSTKGLTAGDYVYDLKLNLSGVSTKLLEGRFTVRGSAS